MGGCFSINRNLELLIQRSIQVQVEGLERFSRKQSEIEAQQSEIKALQVKIKTQQGEIKAQLEKMGKEALFKEKNPWFDMSESDSSKAQSVGGKVIERLNKLGCPFECMVTKCRDVNILKVVHILPDSTKKSIMNDLKLPYNFRNDVTAERWNFMVLRNDIQEAFDSLKISFVPENLLKPEDFFLNIVEEGSLDNDIKALAGRKLIVPSGIALSRRALSYQAYMAYMQATYRDSAVDLDVPYDFSSDCKGKDEVRDRLASLIVSSIHNENLELLEASDDES